MTRAPTTTTHSLSALRSAVVDDGLPAARALAGVAHHLAETLAPAVDFALGGPLLDGTVDPAAVAALLPTKASPGPELLGEVLEVLQARELRRRRGAFFTPRASADRVVDRATQAWTWPVRPRVCDPACGGGAFLLAAARALDERGIARDEIVTDLLWGIDNDPMAVAVTQASLALWCASGGAPEPNHIVHGDALGDGPDGWDCDQRTFDLVVGNPPFQSQLASRTARSRQQAASASERFGVLSRGYADSATLFLFVASTLTRSGGRFSLILPESFLAARDATPVRHAVARDAALVGLWLPGAPLFSASVRVCVPVFEAGTGSTRIIRRWRGVDAETVSPTRAEYDLTTTSTWAPLAADLLGVPPVDLATGPRLGDCATATAGFRDQFYGVRPFVHAGGSRSDPRLITSGAIDLVNDLWARRTTKFAGASIAQPVVDIDRLRAEAPSLAGWADRVLVPKLVVATQTRIVEVLVDERGAMWPSVPVIAVVAPRDQLWSLAAALASPPVSAECLRRHAGAALSSDAIKLSAKQVLGIGLPVDEDTWATGTGALRAASAAAACGDGSQWRSELERFGGAMCDAYAVTHDVLEWWLARPALPLNGCGRRAQNYARRR